MFWTVWNSAYFNKLNGTVRCCTVLNWIHFNLTLICSMMSRNFFITIISLHTSFIVIFNILFTAQISSSQSPPFSPPLFSSTLCFTFVFYLFLPKQAPFKVQYIFTRPPIINNIQHFNLQGEKGNLKYSPTSFSST